MNDEKLEVAREFLNTFPSFEDFKRDYLDKYKPANAKFLTFLYKQIKDKPDVWKQAKYMISTDTLRVDLMLKGKENICINDIIAAVKNTDLSKYKRIFVKLENKDYDDIDKLKALGIDVCLDIYGNKGYCTIDDFKYQREFFNVFKTEYSYQNLSLLEKITLAYDHVKFFKYNSEDSDLITDSRSISSSIKTGFIVCEAYSRIFCQLLLELGVSSYFVNIAPNEKDSYGHARVFIKIHDDKYNVHGVFAFDPTWDSDMQMAYVKHKNGTCTYEMDKYILDADEVIETMPSGIRYLYYLVPLIEYDKYFHGDEVNSITKYPTFNELDIKGTINETLHFNDLRPRDRSVLSILPNLLRKTKKLEGFSDEDIEKYINHAINIVKQNRFGRLEKRAAVQKGIER